MNYELARQLKEAGFPQEGNGYIAEHPECKGWDSPHPDCTNAKRPYVPTLSELIEACGEKHYIARRELTQVNPKRDETTTTTANGSRVMEYRNFCLFGYPGSKWVAAFGLEGQYYDLKGEGPNPEEAVARLWLALNKK